MRFRQLTVILFFLWLGFDVRAQVPEEVSPVPEQWQLTLDVIKSKAKTLLVENNGLQVEYRKLIEQVQKLQRLIDEEQRKNEGIDRFLKERHGRTDQQARIEELTKIIKTKRQEAGIVDDQLAKLKRRQANLGRLTLQNSIQPIGDDQLSQWRKQLEEENRQEVLLENKLRGLKAGGEMQNPDGDAITQQNKQLEARLDALRLQKLQGIKNVSDAAMGQAKARRYAQLTKRKDQIVEKINAYALHLDELSEFSMTALSWQEKKKKLIHEMVQTDFRNNQIRDKIKALREDIDVLRNQVAKLERRVNFVQDKDTKQ